MTKIYTYVLQHCILKTTRILSTQIFRFYHNITHTISQYSKKKKKSNF